MKKYDLYKKFTCIITLSLSKQILASWSVHEDLLVHCLRFRNIKRAKMWLQSFHHTSVASKVKLDYVLLEAINRKQHFTTVAPINRS